MLKVVSAAVAVVFIVALEAVSYWSVLDPVLRVLKRSGASGNLVAQIALSPLFVLVLAVAALGLAMRGVAEIRDKSKSNIQTSPASGATVLSPTIHIENKPTFAQSTGPALSSNSPAVFAPPPERPKPNVVFLGAEVVHIDIKGPPSSESFYRSKDGKGRALVGCFRNDIREYGVRIADTDATAQLIFRAQDGNEIGKGILGMCWLDNQGDYFELDVGKSGCVILGLMSGDGEFVVPWRRRTRTSWGEGIVTELYEIPRKPTTVEVKLIGFSNNLLLEPVVIVISEYEL